MYHGEKPEYLEKSLKSMFEQTLKPAQLVIVCDGALTPGLDRVLEDFCAGLPDKICIVRLTKNVGLGVALGEGLPHCAHELVARMDSDDISLPERCALQIAAFEKEPELVITGGQIAEFDSDSEIITGVRRLPESDKDIRAFSTKRNPFNHMAVMFRKSAVMSAGNYQPMPYFEDWWLWVRLLPLGKAVNLPEILVKARAGRDMISRRGGLTYALHTLRFQNALRKSGYVTMRRYLQNCFVRCGVSIMPKALRGVMYAHFLRGPYHDL